MQILNILKSLNKYCAHHYYKYVQKYPLPEQIIYNLVGRYYFEQFRIK